VPNLLSPKLTVHLLRRGMRIFCHEQFQTANSYLMGVTNWVLMWNVPDRQNETPERFWQDGSPIGCESNLHGESYCVERPLGLIMFFALVSRHYQLRGWPVD